MIGVILVLTVCFIILAVSYAGMLARLRRLENELSITKQSLEEMGNEVNMQSIALQSVNEYVKTSSTCILDIARELEKVIGKTAWMDGIDEALVKSLDIDNNE